MAGRGNPPTGASARRMPSTFVAPSNAVLQGCREPTTSDMHSRRSHLDPHEQRARGSRSGCGQVSSWSVAAGRHAATLPRARRRAYWSRGGGGTALLRLFTPLTSTLPHRDEKLEGIPLRRRRSRESPPHGACRTSARGSRSRPGASPSRKVSSDRIGPKRASTSSSRSSAAFSASASGASSAGARREGAAWRCSRGESRRP